MQWSNSKGRGWWARLLITALLALSLVGCAYRNHMKRGDELYEMGQYEAALVEYQEALRLKPDKQDAQVKVADAKSAVIRQYTAEARERLDARDYAAAIEATLRLRQRLPDESPVGQLVRDVSNRVQLEAATAAEQGEWARALDLLMMLYESFEGERAGLEPEIARVKKTWGAQLSARAAQAEEAGHLGDALLLYAKASELVVDPVNVSKRDELRARLIDESAYLVKLEGRGKHYKVVSQALMTSSFPQNVRFAERARAKGAQATARLEVGAPKFRRDVSTYTKTARYKSGTRQVPNPQYQSRQDDILSEERELQRYQEDVAEYQDQVNRYSEQVAREGDTPNVSTGAEQNLQRARSNLQRAQENVARAQDRVIRAKERAANTPQFIEEDVYSDLNYPVNTHRISGKSAFKFQISHDDGRAAIPDEGVIAVSASDDEHAAYPIANVPQDPLDLPGEASLTQDLYAKATSLAFNVVNDSLQGHRQALLERAFATEDQGERIHMYVIYILLDPTQVNPQVTAEIDSARGIPDSASVLARSGEQP